MKLTKTQLAVLALITANTIWGIGPPIYKLALQNIGTFTFAFIRFALATIMIFPFVKGKLKVEKGDMAEVFLAGFFGIVVNISFFLLGLKLAPSINSSIITCAAPIFLILGSFLFLGEKLKKRLIIGTFVGLFGILLIIFEPIFSSQPNLDFIGNLFFFISMMGALAHTIIGRELVKKYDPLGITFWTFLISSLCFLPMAVNENLTHNYLSTMNIPVLIAIFWGAIFSSTIAYFLLFWALKYMPAASTGVFIYLDPIATILVAYPLLGEKPDAFYLIGSLFVFLGIYIAERRIHYHPIHLLRKGAVES
ncbi:MAG TPA: DMT family transporter [Patescibacteria group bacterium]|nr:DMT family transporter [Patescibacteria group bacterium]